MKTIGTALALLMLMGAFTASLAADILFDESHGQHEPMSSAARFSDARSALTGAGHTISAHNGSVTLAALANYDIYVTGTLDFGFTADEVQALQDFVTTGGSVLVIHDGGFSADAGTASINSFLAPYGMAMSSNSTFGGGLIASGFSGHCLTAGVQSVGLDYIRTLSSISSPAEDLTTSGAEVLAVYEGGNGGMVIAFADDSLWNNAGVGSDYNINDFDNRTLLLSLFNCLTGPVAIENVSWGDVKSLYR